MTLPKHVRKKVAKGRTYYYYSTGVKIDGKPVMKRLPDIRDPDFGRMLAAAQSGRTRRGKVKGALTVPGLADLYEKSPEFRNLSASTQRSYVANLEKMRNDEGLRIAPADALTPADVRLLHDGMAEHTGAANQFVRVLGALYSWGRKRGHVTVKPCEDVEMFDETPHEKWPDHLLAKALADPDIQLPVALLYYTAQRIGDVCKMRWSDVQDGVISITQQKTGKALAIPFHSELAKILATTPRTGLTILTHGERPYSAGTLRKRIQAWSGADVVPHGLRKNAVIALLEADCSVAETAAISGQTLQMVEHYAKQRNQAKLASAAILRWEGKR